jgi:hypothetical protein
MAGRVRDLQRRNEEKQFQYGAQKGIKTVRILLYRTEIRPPPLQFIYLPVQEAGDGDPSSSKSAIA